MEKELKYAAHNYKPLPVVIHKGQGIFVWDVEGKKYYDFLCGYSSNNQGHSHPKILKTLYEQSQLVTMTSRAFMNDRLPDTAEYLTKLFGYEKMLPMNSGVEACETACKIARKWGYVKKGIPDNKARIVVMEGNFWGRTITASGACDDPSRYTNFGPFTPGFDLCPYNDIKALEHIFERHHGHLCAVLLEPI